ncbi:hypothetical protein KR067_013105, partial [Drosophila pandora]
TETKFEFTNIKCNATDPKFGNFRYCYIKAINRTYKYISLRYYSTQVPYTNIRVNLGLYKRFNGYKPFLYNISINACKFLKSPKTYPVLKFFFDMIYPASNFNHTCPYDHDIIFEKFSGAMVNHHFTNVLPFSEGDYLIDVKWLVYEVERAVTMFYGTLS